MLINWFAPAIKGGVSFWLAGWNRSQASKLPVGNDDQLRACFDFDRKLEVYPTCMPRPSRFDMLSGIWLKSKTQRLRHEGSRRATGRSVPPRAGIVDHRTYVRELAEVLHVRSFQFAGLVRHKDGRPLSGAVQRLIQPDAVSGNAVDQSFATRTSSWLCSVMSRYLTRLRRDSS